jgi:hypothetical protein
MNEETRVRLLQTLAAVIVVVTLILLIDAIAHAQEPVVVEGDYPVIWLVIDGTAVGTVKPGTFEYDYTNNVIRVESNELVYGCQQSVIFRDRFSIKPN